MGNLTKRDTWARIALRALRVLPDESQRDLDFVLLRRFGCNAKINGKERTIQTQCGYSCLVCIYSKAPVKEKKESLICIVKAQIQKMTFLKVNIEQTRF